MLGDRLGPSTLGAVPKECQQAIFDGGAFEARCARQPAFSLVELLTMSGMSAANAACEQATGMSLRCHDGRMCRVGPNGDECIQCDRDGNCWRFRSYESAGTAPANIDDRRPRPAPEPPSPPPPPEEQGKKAPGEPDDKKGSTVEEKKQEDKEASERLREAAEEAHNARSTRELSARNTDGHQGPEPLPHDAQTTTSGGRDSGTPFPPRGQDERMACLRTGTCPNMRMPNGLPPPPIRKEAGTPPGHSHAASAGDPVLVGTGQLEHSVVDLEVAAAPGSLVHFELRRHYTSDGITQGVLGRSWGHEYEERLVPVTEFFPGAENLPLHCVEALPTVRCMALETADGRRQIFVQDPYTTVFLPPPGTYAGLRRTSQDNWALRDAAGTVRLFDPRGRLRAIEDRRGNRLNLYYGEKDEGPLQAIVDPLQRIIAFAYDGQGRLSSVSDFAGRWVSYEYEALSVRSASDVPGLFPSQSRLVKVTRSVPASLSGDAGKRRATTTSYKYLSLADANAALPTAPPTPPRSFACGPEIQALKEHITREVLLDHLLGDLVEIADSDGRPVLRVTYELDSKSPDFDRVRSERYWEAAAQNGASASFLYTTKADAVPAEVRAGLGAQGLLGIDIGATSCRDVWHKHAGRPVLSYERTVLEGRLEETRELFVPLFDRLGWFHGKARLDVLDLVGRIGVSIPELERDAATVCQWTKFQDQIGRTTWYGVNFMGGALVEAREAPADEPARWSRTLRRFNAHGEPVALRTPGGRLEERSYDALSKSPLSRGNLRSVTETPTGGGAARTTAYEYEPLYNQPLLERGPLGDETRYVYDYMEGDASTDTAATWTLLEYGSTAASLAELSPSLTLLGRDLNGDGYRSSGDLIVRTEPTATLADGGRQPYETVLAYNDFGQVVSARTPGRATTFVYYAANHPTGGDDVVMSSTFTAYLSPARRAARWSAGGMLAEVSHVLDQGPSAAALGKPALTAATVKLRHDVLGNSTSVTDPSGSTETREHDGFGNVIRRVDGEGYEQRMIFDAGQNLTFSAEDIDREGRKRITVRHYDVAGNGTGVCRAIDAAGCSAPLGELVAARQRQSPALSLTTFEYDAEGRRLAEVDPDGHRHALGLDTLDRVISRQRGAETTTYRYSPEGDAVAITTGAGDVNRLERDGWGRVTGEVWPNGTRIERDWDARDRLLAWRAVDGSGTALAGARFVRDERGRVREHAERWILPADALVAALSAPERITTLQLDPHGAPVRLSDSSGAAWRIERDSLGQVARTVDPVGNEVLTYRDLAKRTVETRERGEGRDRRREVALDSRGLAVAVTLSGPGVRALTRTDYDGLADVVSETDAVGNTVVHDHDLLGRRTKTSTPRTEAGGADLSTTFGYDRRGHVVSVRDAGGVVTTRVFGPSGRLTSETAGGVTTTTRYDAAGRWAQIDEADGTTLTARYERGLLSGVDSAMGAETRSMRRLVRDGLGRITQAWEKGRPFWTSTQLQYDSFGRVLSDRTTVYWAGLRASWSVPPAQLLQIGDLRSRFGYDASTRRAIEYPSGATATAVADPAGRTRSISLGEIGADIDWQWERVRATKVAGLVRSETSFDAIGRPIDGSVMLPADQLGVREERALDPLGRVRMQVLATPRSARTRTVRYGGSGWIDDVLELPVGASVTPLDTNADVAALGEYFATLVGIRPVRTSLRRDPVGTLVAEDRDDGAPSPFAGAPAPADHAYRSGVSLDGVAVTPAYDARGRITEDGRNRLRFDDHDRLSLATPVGGRPVWLGHDAFGRRVARVTAVPNGLLLERPETSDVYAYAGWETVASARNGRVVDQTLLGPELDRPLAIVAASGEAMYPFYDLQGNVAGVLDARGAPLERYAYDLDGRVTVSDAAGVVTCQEKGTTVCAMKSRRGWNGQARDGDTGLYDYRHRVYSPALRSFLSKDPLGYVDSYDPWSYVGGDPLNRTDPYGLFASNQVVVDDDVHGFIFRMALGTDARGGFMTGQLGKDVWSMIRSSRAFDEDQSAAVQPLHYTYDPVVDTPESAKVKYEEFLDQSFHGAVDAEIRGDHATAMTQLGRHLHAVQDRFSYPHLGPNGAPAPFPVTTKGSSLPQRTTSWLGHKLQQVWHGVREMVIGQNLAAEVAAAEETRRVYERFLREVAKDGAPPAPLPHKKPCQD